MEPLCFAQNFCFGERMVITMLVNYDIQKINAALSDFYNATGIYMDLLTEDFTSVGNHSHWESNRYCKAVQNTKVGKKACHCSDATLLEMCRESRKTEVHFCHAGLVDIAVPIIYEEEIIGYIIFGQMKTNRDFSAIRKYLASLGLDTEEMQKYYTEISFFDKDRIQSVSNIASMLIKHILLENLLKPYRDENMQKAVSFINQNLEKELSIKDIVKNVNMSKSVLYKRFHAFFGCTVSEYISRQRIERSVSLLSKTDMSIEDISQKTGFASASYYSKIFKKLKGISPAKYRSSQCFEKNNK